MKVTYIGDEIAVALFGMTFPKGQAVEVTDEHAQRKLAANPQFSVAGAADTKPKKEAKS